MTHRILVVPTVPVSEAMIRSHLSDAVLNDAEIEIVAPASNIGRLDWLTNAEDDARAEAADRGKELAVALPTDAVDAHVGDTDPLQAIADALRTFPADEVIIVTRSDEHATWLEAGTGPTAQERLSLPVTHLVVSVNESDP
jgi:hypothetical protein